MSTPRLIKEAVGLFAKIHALTGRTGRRAGFSGCLASARAFPKKDAARLLDLAQSLIDAAGDDRMALDNAPQFGMLFHNIGFFLDEERGKASGFIRPRGH